MRRVLVVRAIVCGLAALLTTGCTGMAGLVVLYIAFDQERKGGPGRMGTPARGR